MNIGIALALVLAQDVELVAPAFSLRQNKPQLSFQLKVGEGVLLGVDILKVGVSSWTDDQGTSLGTKDAKQFYGEASVMTQGSGADLVAQVMGKNKPADGATSMSIEGEIPVKIGLDFQEGESKGVVLKEGAVFDVGPYAFKVAKVEKVNESFDFKPQDALRVRFKFDSKVQLKSFDFLKRFTFLNGDGKERKSKQKNFQGSFQGGGEHEITILILPSEEPATVQWSVYGRIETVVVPLKHAGPIGK